MGDHGDEVPRVVRTERVRRRSRRRRVAERFGLVIGLPALLFVLVALSAGVIEYIPATQPAVPYAPVADRAYEPPAMVDLAFDHKSRRRSTLSTYDGSKRRALLEKNQK
jgi:hypothetical protein